MGYYIFVWSLREKGKVTDFGLDWGFGKLVTYTHPTFIRVPLPGKILNCFLLQKLESRVEL